MKYIIRLDEDEFNELVTCLQLTLLCYRQEEHENEENEEYNPHLHRSKVNTEIILQKLAYARARYNAKRLKEARERRNAKQS